jgi:hypothetical protein
LPGVSRLLLYAPYY